MRKVPDISNLSNEPDTVFHGRDKRIFEPLTFEFHAKNFTQSIKIYFWYIYHISSQRAVLAVLFNELHVKILICRICFVFIINKHYPPSLAIAICGQV